MTPSPTVSVIIPTCNRKETLLACLESLAAQRVGPASFEVIVVDDGSTDGTEDMLAERRGILGLRLVVERQDRQGPGAARNLGARRALGEILAFTEDDVILDPAWLERALAYFEDPSTSAVEGRTLLGSEASALRLLETGHQLGFVPCNFFVRAEDFHLVGGYSPAYFDAASRLYFREDADFGFKLIERGKRVLFAPDVVVTHPPLYASAAGYLRHARRYQFDPLLYREHPRLYREMIEVKHLAGFTIRRPFHWLCLLYVAGLVLLVAAPSVWAWAAVAVSFLALWYRYERTAMRLAHAPVILVLPLVYLAAFARGCIRYRSFGALL